LKITWLIPPQEIPFTVLADINLADGACFRTKQIKMHNLKKTEGFTEQNITEMRRITFNKSFVQLNQQCITYHIDFKTNINKYIYLLLKQKLIK